MSHNRHVSVSSNVQPWGTTSVPPRSADALLENPPPPAALEAQKQEASEKPASLTQKTKTKHAPVVLVAVDLARFSLEALKTGMRLASAAKGELVLFHAIHLNLSSRAADVSLLTARLQKEARKELEPLLVLAHSAGLKASCAVQSGTHPEAILQAATQLGANMIVLGAGHRGFWSRLFGNRTCERVIHGAKCPVFVVNETREKNFLEF